MEKIKVSKKTTNVIKNASKEEIQRYATLHVEEQLRKERHSDSFRIRTVMDIDTRKIRLYAYDFSPQIRMLLVRDKQLPIEKRICKFVNHHGHVNAWSEQGIWLDREDFFRFSLLCRRLGRRSVLLYRPQFE